MKQVTILLFLLCLTSAVSFAQKDAPVSGHAAELLDKLKRDYNAIDPTTKNEEIAKDRTAVIAIFKGYLEDSFRVKLSSSTFIAKGKKVDSLFERLSLAKRNLASYPTATPVNETSALAARNQISGLTDRVEAEQKLYYEARFNADSTELVEIKTQYADNEFLSVMVGLFIKKYQSIKNYSLDSLSSSNYTSSIQKSIPFVGGGLSFETVIDGLARFLAKRIKEELTTYVISRVQDWLNKGGPDDPFAEFKVLLPRTTAYLQGFKADKVTNFVNEIKQYIEDDLRHLLENAPNLRNTPRLQKLIFAHPDLDFALEALELIPAISKIKYPVDYFTFLENSKNIERWSADGSNATKKNIGNAVKMVALLSRSLIVVDNGEPRFAGVDFMTAYAAESNFFRLYLGFLRQQNKKYYGINFQGSKNPITLETILTDKIISPAALGQFDDNKRLFRLLLTEASDNAERVFSLATDIRKASKGGRTIGADTAYNFIGSVIDFSEKITISADSLIKAFSAGENIYLQKKMDPYFRVSRNINDIIYDVRGKRYSTALIRGIELGATITNSQQLYSFATIVAQASTFNRSGRESSWKKVIELGQGNANLTIDKDLKPVFNAVGAELSKVEFFYKMNYTDQSMATKIKAVKDLCLNANIGTTIITTDLGAINTLANNADFKKLVVSYYSGQALNTVSAKLKDELSSISFVDAAGTQTPLFSTTMIDRLITRMEDYATSRFKDYFIDGLKKESDATKAIKEEVTEMINQFISLAPQGLSVQLNPNLLLLIHFVNDMAVAKDAEDVEKAIDAFALPSGSYAIKRKSKSNFAINSYPGILIGTQSAYLDNDRKFAFSVGFTAPVGISWAQGLGNGGSLGFFVPVIDIGAVTRLRLDSAKNTQTLPEFNFKNILSPGFYISYGLPKTVFSINAGLQYGPQLKEILPGGETKSYDSYFIGVGLVLDIPLLNLHTKPKKN